MAFNQLKLHGFSRQLIFRLHKPFVRNVRATQEFTKCSCNPLDTPHHQLKLFSNGTLNSIQHHCLHTSSAQYVFSTVRRNSDLDINGKQKKRKSETQEDGEKEEVKKEAQGDGKKKESKETQEKEPKQEKKPWLAIDRTKTFDLYQHYPFFLLCLYLVFVMKRFEKNKPYTPSRAYKKALNRCSKLPFLQDEFGENFAVAGEPFSINQLKPFKYHLVESGGEKFITIQLNIKSADMKKSGKATVEFIFSQEQNCWEFLHIFAKILVKPERKITLLETGKRAPTPDTASDYKLLETESTVHAFEDPSDEQKIETVQQKA